MKWFLYSIGLLVSLSVVESKFRNTKSKPKLIAVILLAVIVCIISASYMYKVLGYLPIFSDVRAGFYLGIICQLLLVIFTLALLDFQAKTGTDLQNFIFVLQFNVFSQFAAVGFVKALHLALVLPPSNVANYGLYLLAHLIVTSVVYVVSNIISWGILILVVLFADNDAM